MRNFAALRHLRTTYLLGSMGVAMLVTPFAQAATHHVVEAGETLSEIAAHYNLSTTMLIDANGLEASYIRTGEVLNIPHPDTQHNIYRVVAGDNLSSLAKQYNLSVTALAEANHMSPQSGLMIDSTLVLPVSGVQDKDEKTAAKTIEITATETRITEKPKSTVAKKPVTKAKPVPQKLTPASNQTHRIEYGETLLNIANKYSINVMQLAAANDMSVNDTLYFGRTLSIPATAAVRKSAQSLAPQALPSTYTVKAGDTLMGIANRHEVSFLDIATKSNISPYDALAVGQVLSLPTKARTL